MKGLVRGKPPPLDALQVRRELDGEHVFDSALDKTAKMVTVSAKHGTEELIKVGFTT